VHLWWFSEKSIDVLARRLGCRADFVDFGSYNARDPVLHTFSCVHAPQLDAAGRVLRRESFPMTLARKWGLLHEGYWLASRAGGLVKRGDVSSRNRPTMVAVLRRA
jgi:hypothetical protein